MRHTLPIAPQFYVTAPQPCPYLDGRMERKLFTALQGDSATKLNNSLSGQGFRRSQNVLYRPSCTDCAACLSARINVADFTPSKSQKRTIKRNAGLTRRATSPWATEEQYDLFRTYLDSRHADGGMADMDVFEFAAMIEETPIRSRVIEYTDTQTRELIGVCLTDVLDDGVSMVYSFYSPTGPVTGWAITSSLTTSKSPVRRVCLMYIWAIGCPAAPRWAIRPSSRGLRSIWAARGRRCATPMISNPNSIR